MNLGTQGIRSVNSIIVLSFALLISVLFLLRKEVSVYADNMIVGPDAPGSISGHATDRKGKALMGINVTLISNGFYRTSVTDGSGFYKFPLLPPGEYLVGFNSFTPQEYLTEYYSNSITLEGATRLQVAGSSLENVDATLTLASKITGTVSFVGIPITTTDAVAIRIYRFDPKTFRWADISGDTLVVAGDYVIDGLSAGTYRVCGLIYLTGKASSLVSCYGDAFYVATAQDIIVEEEATQTGINMVFRDNPDAATISGRVIDTSGNPISGTTVYAYPFDYSDPLLWNSYTATTDQNGDYRIDSLIPNVVSYTVSFSDVGGNHIGEYYNNQMNAESATKFTPHTRQVISNINAVLESAAHISGTITLQGEIPYIDGTINLLRKVGNEWQSIAWGLIDKTSGNFHLAGLSGGIYRICAAYYFSPYQPVEGCYGGRTIENATGISLTPSEVRSNVNFDISTKQYDGRISGRVNTAGTPLAGIRVDLINNSEYINSCDNPPVREFQHRLTKEKLMAERSVASVVYTTTDAQGTYKFGGLPPGSYFVRASDPQFRYGTTFYTETPTEQPISTLPIACEQILQNVNISMTKAGVVSGKITIASGIPLSNTEVYLMWANGYGFQPLNLFAMTTESGSYVIRGVEPGNYWLQAYSSVNVYPYGGYSEFYGSSEDIYNTPKTITVTSGITTTGIDIILGPDGVIWLPLISQK